MAPTETGAPSLEVGTGRAESAQRTAPLISCKLLCTGTVRASAWTAQLPHVSAIPCRLARAWPHQARRAQKRRGGEDWRPWRWAGGPRCMVGWNESSKLRSWLQLRWARVREAFRINSVGASVAPTSTRSSLSTLTLSTALDDTSLQCKLLGCSRASAPAQARPARVPSSPHSLTPKPPRRPRRHAHPPLDARAARHGED